MTFFLTLSNYHIKALLAFFIKNNPLSPNRINVISEINVIKVTIFDHFCFDKSLLNWIANFPIKLRSTLASGGDAKEYL